MKPANILDLSFFEITRHKKRVEFCFAVKESQCPPPSQIQAIKYDEVAFSSYKMPASNLGLMNLKSGKNALLNDVQVGRMKT